jgi:hypothetical protein
MRARQQQARTAEDARAILLAGADMVLWNAQALSVPTMAGFPMGPVTMPPYGMPLVSRGKLCPDANCRHHFLNETRGYFWFGHKTPWQWQALYREWYGACDGAWS